MTINQQFPASVSACRQLNVEQQSSEYPPRAETALSRAAATEALDEIQSWPGYGATPLHRLTKLEALLGCGEIHYKDESARFGLGSFKALGGAYAVLKLVASLYRQDHAQDIALGDIRKGKIKDYAQSVTVATATDGNHGRSVAWGAKNAGCPCRIYIHAEVSQGRANAMQDLGAEVIRIEGDYDESVRRCASDVEKNGWHMVSDTSYDGYTAIPSDVMAGYTVLASEIVQQLEAPPTHIFVQAGVGGLAGAVCARLWMEYGRVRPHITLVESDYSACVLQSFEDSSPASVEIVSETVMAGLSCGEMSLLAWEILSNCCDQVVTLDDDSVAPAMKWFADSRMADFTIEAGECAVPGVLALMAMAGTTDYKDARVLVLGCEGATDPILYKKLLESVAG